METEGIAIIGMSGRFPGANSVQEFWRNLIGGKDSITHFREEELEYSVASEPEQAAGQNYVKARGVLDRVDQFDAAFFDINPHEAELMDPQHRLFLECAWESLEGAGYNPGEYPGLVGVFAGCSLNSYLLFNLCKDREFAAGLAGNYQVGRYAILLGNGNDFLATRVSYKLNLKGPSMAIQTACSTSLVTVCQACTSLLAYQCDMALAGGAAISFPQKRDYLFQDGSLVSGDGSCRAFDAAADGTVFGNGVAVVLLKRLAEAVADGDHVLAVIQGTAINNDGMAKVSYAAPSVTAQAEVIAMAQAAANVDPETISYIEAHGTGTPLGDPIELAALTQAFRNGGATRNGYCPIGTGKTHIGHLDIAAGATGLIKTILQLQHELIPPLLHFRSPNPKIDFAHSPFFPVSRQIEWKRGEQPRRAGVSAFGVGGTNAHIVLEEAPSAKAGSASRAAQLLVLSAKTETALEQMAENLATHLLANSEQDFSDVAHTLMVGRKSFPHRRALVAGKAAEAAGKLRSHDAKSVFSGTAAPNGPAMVFLFPGQGAQYVNMGRGLYDTEAVFRREVDRCAAILETHLGQDIRAILYPNADHRPAAEIQINETAVTQPAIFTVEYALARLWISWGVKPAVLIGHSIGEYVAAVLAETCTLENALSLLAARAKLMQALPAGAMLAVRLDGQTVTALLPPGVSLAALNGPKLCTVSGPIEILKTWQSALEAKNIASRLLATSHAFHSAMMDPMLPEFTKLAERTPWAAPKIPWISTCTGNWITAGDLADPAYWSRQLRQTVHFAEAIEVVIKDAGKAVLEVGPGQALATMAMQNPARAKELVVASTLPPSQTPAEEQACMLTTLGKLWVAGVKPDWAGFYAHEQRHRVPLPTYPFERRRHWVEPVKETGTAGPIPGAAQLDGNKVSSNDLEQVIHKQLRQMAEQLDRLQACESPAAPNHI